MSEFYYISNIMAVQCCPTDRETTKVRGTWVPKPLYMRAVSGTFKRLPRRYLFAIWEYQLATNTCDRLVMLVPGGDHTASGEPT